MENCTILPFIFVIQQKKIPTKNEEIEFNLFYAVGEYISRLFRFNIVLFFFLILFFVFICLRLFFIRAIESSGSMSYDFNKKETLKVKSIELYSLCFCVRVDVDTRYRIPVH